MEISPSLSDTKYTSKDISQYKKDLQELKKRYTQALEKAEESVLDETNEVTMYLHGSKESLINQSNSNAYKQYEKLEASKRKILEIEKTGIDAQRELHQQTNTMLRVNTNIQSMNIELDDSNKLTKAMLRRENKNKLMICMILIALALVIVISIFLQFSKDSSANQDTAKK